MGGGVALGAEWGFREWSSNGWLLLQVTAIACALGYAWREQDRLRLPTVLAVAALFQVGYIALHLGLDVAGDLDSRVVFRWQGNAILDGYYPRSEYPPGAVLLFALEALVGGGTTRVSNALLMVPFGLALVAAVWLLRTPFSAWLAAFAALWPMNAFFWEFKYDLVPAALLALGLLLAYRRSWGWSGIILGLGALVKWTPALAAVALVAWLLTRREVANAVRHAAGVAAAILVPLVPLLLWDADAVLAFWDRQSGRPITAESVWYLPLHALGLAEVHGHISFGAGAPDWARPVAVVAQAALVFAAVVFAARAGSIGGAVTAAACTPALFLLSNRIFSPQFAVVLVAAWTVAASLVVRSRREQLGVGALMAVATTANAFVYPYALPHYEWTWQLASATLFACGLALTLWLLVRTRQPV
jgi:Glycosyltransferase family 87